MSHINYGLLLWGTNINKISRLQKKAIRIISGSAYRAHTEPLFKEFGLLNVNDLFHLKLLKFYYKLSYNLLPSYFDCYLQVINKAISHTYNLRPCARPLLRLPRTRLVSSESSVLYQLIKLINITNEINPEILIKVKEKTHSYYGFNFNVTQIYFQRYSYECTKAICYTCGRNT